MKLKQTIQNILYECDSNFEKIDIEIESLDKQIVECREKQRKGKTLEDKIHWEIECKVLVKDRSTMRRDYYVIQDGFKLEALEKIRLSLADSYVKPFITKY